MKSVLTKPGLLLTQLALGLALLSVSLLLRQLPAQGYGYGTCAAVAPTDLAVTTANHGRRLHFSWDEVTFSECDTIAVDHYRFQIRLNNSTLILSSDNLAQPHTNILLRTLRRNHVYKFRVKAVASDGSSTEWSDYKLFRTTPKPPQHLSVDSISLHRAVASWTNVTRSRYLRYYQVVVYRRAQVVFSKKVRVGLRRHSAQVLLRRLRPDTRYTLKVRAVANQSTHSQYATTKFTHTFSQ